MRVVICFLACVFTSCHGLGRVSAQKVFPPAEEAKESKRQVLNQIRSATPKEERPPNVVILFADDLGYADIGAYGSTTIPTPHLDALSRQGSRFSNAYATAATCSPSRAGLLTGYHQQRFGFEFNTGGGRPTHRFYRGLDPAAITIADILGAAGYATGMFGKWHLGTHPHLHPQSRGFSEFYGFLAGAHSYLRGSADEPVFRSIMRGRTPIHESDYLTDAIARETIDFIDRHYDQPFFAYVPFNAVHTPLEASRKYLDRFPENLSDDQRTYNAMTSALDDAVGKIVSALDRHQLSDRTLVIFTNDNGGPVYTRVQSNGPLKLGKLYLFEGGIRVPLIIRWPGMSKPNVQIDSITSLLDLFPTICAAANIEVPQAIPLDGVNLADRFSGQTGEKQTRTLFWSNGPNIAVRSGNWKMVQSHDSLWLFDLEHDPGEKRNLASQQPEIVAQLQRQHHDWRQGMKSPAWPSKPQRRQVDVDGQIYEIHI